MLTCCRRAWFRCWLDHALHAVGIHSRAICDWHDRAIVREF